MVKKKTSRQRREIVVDFFLVVYSEMLSIDVKMFEKAAKMNIWRHVWRENYAETIVRFVDGDFVGVEISN